MRSKRSRSFVPQSPAKDAAIAYPRRSSLAEIQDLSKRWQKEQNLAYHFWQRWCKEYFPSIVKALQWYGKTHDIPVGQLVYLSNTKEWQVTRKNFCTEPRSKWKDTSWWFEDQLRNNQTSSDKAPSYLTGAPMGGRPFLILFSKFLFGPYCQNYHLVHF